MAAPLVPAQRVMLQLFVEVPGEPWPPEPATYTVAFFEMADSLAELERWLRRRLTAEPAPEPAAGPAEPVPGQIGWIEP